MQECRVCGAHLVSQEAQERGCCDVPRFASLEEQMDFWLTHDRDRCCAECDAASCDRRPAH